LLQGGPVHDHDGQGNHAERYRTARQEPFSEDQQGEAAEADAERRQVDVSEMPNQVDDAGKEIAAALLIRTAWAAGWWR
jgi:hypothetical protein